MGENHLTEGEKNFHLNNEDSNIVFLEDHERVFIHIAYTCPFEYSMNGATGFRYDAIKDFLRWNSDATYDPDEIHKEHLETFLQLGRFLAKELADNAKSNRR